MSGRRFRCRCICPTLCSCKFDYFRRSVFVDDSYRINRELLTISDRHPFIAVGGFWLHVSHSGVRPKIWMRGLREVAMSLNLIIQSVEFGRFNRRHDYRGAIGRLAGREYVRLSESGFERCLLGQELLDAFSVVALNPVTHGDMVAFYVLPLAG